MPLQIVIPIYNDWESMVALLPIVDDQLQKASVVSEVLLVDDGSTVSPPTSWSLDAKHIRVIRVLKLSRNLGHQRAICIALCHLRNSSSCQRVLVMDGDGEDAPSDIPRLLSELDSKGDVRIVFAERTRRSEGPIFTFFYLLYRILHRFLVGHRVRVGNFSVMRRECLESLCVASELWNHFAATVFATRQPMSMIPTHRSRRIAGTSKMNFPALVMHGLSALSVFSDRISTRLLILSGVAAVASLIGMMAVIIIRLATGFAIPGWATLAFGLLALLLVQVVTFICTFCFVILFSRSLGPFIPIRDHHYFVAEVREVWHGRNP